MERLVPILGWSLILAGFLSGAALGLGFHRDDFLGGYGSFRRRIVRLGHIACVALGMLNLLGTVAGPAGDGALAQAFRGLLAAGGVAMPAVCFLTGWRPAFRHLFALPVAALAGAAACALAAAVGGRHGASP